MATEPINPFAEIQPIPVVNPARARWGGRVAIAAAVVFVISSVFPVAAGLSHHTETFPKWWGPLDVGIAFLLAILVFLIFGFAARKVGKDTEDLSYRAYRILIHGVFVLMVVFLLFGDRIVWPNCLTGLAWRYWLLLYCLPAWLSLLTGSRRHPQGGEGSVAHQERRMR
jgi:hypothetical protein